MFGVLNERRLKSINREKIMHQRLIITFLVCFLICLFGFNLNNSSQKILSSNVSPTATPTPNTSNDLFTIETDRDTVGGSCPTGYKCSGNCDDSPVVIIIFGSKQENNSLRYNYTALSGRVIGGGAKVSWDLKGAQPGTYEIKIDVVDDKSGNLLQSTTKTINVVSCDDGGDRCLSCPVFSVDPPASPTQAGETMIFTANVRHGDASNMIYNWIVSNGKIIEGQGTPTIKVATTSKMAGKAVEATVSFIWDCSEICKNNTASANGLVAKKR
jgi:hypothetical protein